MEFYGVFILLFLLLFIEIALDFYMFNTLDISKLVSCCGTIFSSSSASAISSIFAIKSSVILTLFYANFILMIFFRNNKALFGILNLFFIFTSLVSLILFFGTYVYELPTHHCPFCMLQKEYHYVGYLFYILLFLGTFYGLTFSIFDIKRYKKLSILFNSLYLIAVSLYPILFFIKNGVWL